MRTFVLPWPPSINHCWKHRVVGRRAQVYMSAAGAEFRQAVIAIVKENPLETILGRVSVKVTLHAPTLRKYDVDNFFKSAGDALTHAGVWADDEQIDSLLLYRGEKIKGGKLIVEITRL